MVSSLILDSIQINSVQSKTTNDNQTFTFSDESIEKESFSLFSPVDRQKHCKIIDQGNCSYFKNFLKIVKFLRILFEKLKKEELVYESEIIFRGELNALDQFILRAEKKQNNSKFVIEDLLFDEFFEADNLSEMYNKFIENQLEMEEQLNQSNNKGRSNRCHCHI
jgi:uncharacterized protein YrzB (UPF0473 family)